MANVKMLKLSTSTLEPIHQIQYYNYHRHDGESVFLKLIFDFSIPGCGGGCQVSLN